MDTHVGSGPCGEDAALMALLQDAVVPLSAAALERLRADARAAYSFRALEEELAALAYDSLLDESPATARSLAAPARTLLFESGSVSVQLEVTDDAVVGQVVAPTEATVTVEHPDRRLTVLACDEAGCFTLPGPPAGPVRLRIDADGATTVTEWTDLSRRA